MRNELQRHKRSDKVKWVLTGIMFLLAFVMIAGLILQVFGTGKAKPSEWFKKSDSEQTEQLPAEGGENATAHTRVKAMAATRSVHAYEDLVLVYWGDELIYKIGNSYIMEHLYVDRVDSATVCVYTDPLPSEFFTLYGTYTAKVTFSDRESPVYFSMDRQSDDSLNSGDCSPGDYLSGGKYDAFAVTKVHVLVEKVSVPLPDDPVKDGHTFVGWYYDSAFTRPYDGSPIYDDTRLYAKFEIHKFTVMFNSDGGSEVASQIVNWNTGATLTIPIREKYAFKGWFLPNGTQYTNQPIKENTTLTARWERNVFNVTFVTGGGTEVENTEVNLNTAVTLPTTTRTGYVFKGWFLSDGTEYTNQPVTDDMTLTARWEIQMFTVTFFVNGEVYATKTVEYGQGLAKVAETVNLKMFSVRMESGMPTFDDNGVVVVTENCSVEAQEMSNTDKAINTMKENKWAIIGGVAGGIALIAIIIAVCGGKRKRKR